MRNHSFFQKKTYLSLDKDMSFSDYSAKMIFAHNHMRARAGRRACGVPRRADSFRPKILNELEKGGKAAGIQKERHSEECLSMAEVVIYIFNALRVYG